MVKIGKISGSVALDSFRELDDFIKNKKEQAKKEIAEFITTDNTDNGIVNGLKHYGLI